MLVRRIWDRITGKETQRLADELSSLFAVYQETKSSRDHFRDMSIKALRATDERYEALCNLDMENALLRDLLISTEKVTDRKIVRLCGRITKLKKKIAAAKPEKGKADG